MGQQPTPQDIKERTFKFAVEIVKFCQELDGRGGALRTLGRQLLRCGTSIGANVEEAQAAQSHADFVSKMNIALKEARETTYWLRLLHSSGLLSGTQCTLLQNEADEISRVIGAIIVKTKSRK